MNDLLKTFFSCVTLAVPCLLALKYGWENGVIVFCFGFFCTVGGIALGIFYEADK